jgi:hypothetical protein
MKCEICGKIISSCCQKDDRFTVGGIAIRTQEGFICHKCNDKDPCGMTDAEVWPCCVFDEEHIGAGLWILKIPNNLPIEVEVEATDDDWKMTSYVDGNKLEDLWSEFKYLLLRRPDVVFRRQII